MKKIDQNKIEKDKQLSKLLNETRIESGENLKFRIMQQIATEKALTTKKVYSNTNSTLKGIISVLFIMYTLIICLLAVTYLSNGLEALKSLQLQLSIISIASICSVFGLIMAYDEKRRSKNKHRIK